MNVGAVIERMFQSSREEFSHHGVRSLHGPTVAEYVEEELADHDESNEVDEPGVLS